MTYMHGDEFKPTRFSGWTLFLLMILVVGVVAGLVKVLFGI